MVKAKRQRARQKSQKCHYPWNLLWRHHIGAHVPARHKFILDRLSSHLQRESCFSCWVPDLRKKNGFHFEFILYKKYIYLNIVIPFGVVRCPPPQKRHKETLKWRKHRGTSPISHLHSGSHLVNWSVSFAAGFQYWNCTFCHSGLFCRILIVDF